MPCAVSFLYELQKLLLQLRLRGLAAVLLEHQQIRAYLYAARPHEKAAEQSSFALQPRIPASLSPTPSTKICRLCTDFDRLSTKFDTLSLFNIRGG